MSILAKYDINIFFNTVNNFADSQDFHSLIPYKNLGAGANCTFYIIYHMGQKLFDLDPAVKPKKEC